jgi:hypothetical protein
MAANEDIWVTLQKLSKEFPKNGERVEAALLEYYQSIAHSSAEMQDTANDFFKSVNADKRIKLLAMVVYGDIHNYVPGTERIYRSATLSKKIFLSSEKISGEDRIGDIIQIFMIALAGNNNSALNEMKEEFERGSDTTEEGRFKQFCMAIRLLFSRMLCFDKLDSYENSNRIIKALIPSFYADKNPEDYTAVVLSESQRIKENPSKSQQNTTDSKTIINNIMKKIQDKIDESEDRNFRRVLVALKNDIFRIHHDATDQAGLSDFFRGYEKLLESEKDFSKDLKSCLQEYDRYTRMKGAAAFSIDAFKNLGIFSIEKDKAKKDLEKEDKEIIMEKVSKIQGLISKDEPNKILKESASSPEKQAVSSEEGGEGEVLLDQAIIDEVQNLMVAIEQAYRALDSVEATIDDIERNWQKAIEKVFNIMCIVERECKKASENYGSSLQLFSLESGRNSSRQEAYEAIRTEAAGLLEVVSRVHLSISKAVYAQYKINQGISASCGGKG